MSRIVCLRLPGLRMKVSVVVVAGSPDEGFGNAARESRAGRTSYIDRFSAVCEDPYG